MFQVVFLRHSKNTVWSLKILLWDKTFSSNTETQFLRLCIVK
jgi:hypothetical protein